jgi:hypothetical protein
VSQIGFCYRATGHLIQRTVDYRPQITGDLLWLSPALYMASLCC